MVLNTDYLPTFTDLAGTRTPSYVDGRTLAPVLHGTVTTSRSAVLSEAAAHYSPAYRGIRTVNTDSMPKRRYVEYRKGAREPHRLDLDPTNAPTTTTLYRPFSMRLRRVCRH
jgi:N-acetylglucosamine-6-sulfatase